MLTTRLFAVVAPLHEKFVEISVVHVHFSINHSIHCTVIMVSTGLKFVINTRACFFLELVLFLGVLRLTSMLKLSSHLSILND